MRIVFFPRVRHPLLRALLVLGGGLLAGALLFFGLIVIAAVLAAGALALLLGRWFPRASRKKSGDDVIEGKFRVVDKADAQAVPRAALPRAKTG